MEAFAIALFSTTDFGAPAPPVALDHSISAMWSGFAAWVATWRSTLDPAIWLASGLLALVPGSFAIYKWWHYRNSRLPTRLNELLDREETRLKSVRKDLVKLVTKPSPEVAKVRPPLFVVEPLADLIRRLNWSRWWKPAPLKTAEAEIEIALVAVERQLHFSLRSQALCREQEATAYLLKGAIASARADASAADLAERDRQNRMALNHFSRALEIEPRNAEILEYVAHQHRVLNQLDLAKEAFRELAELTKGSHAFRAMHYRSYLSLGSVLERQHDADKQRSGILAAARESFEGALNSLPADARGHLDHAEIHEGLGRVLEKLNRAMLPAKHYGSALSIYGEILLREPKNKAATAGRDRMCSALTAFHSDDSQPGSSGLIN